MTFAGYVRFAHFGAFGPWVALEALPPNLAELSYFMAFAERLQKGAGPDGRTLVKRPGGSLGYVKNAHLSQRNAANRNAVCLQ